jgi:hypothetical protein
LPVESYIETVIRDRISHNFYFPRLVNTHHEHKESRCCHQTKYTGREKVQERYIPEDVNHKVSL